MKREAVVTYDLGTGCGYAIYAPGRPKPVHGVLRLPPTRTNGSNGPANLLLFNHIAWVDRNFGLAYIGYEQFIAPTGGQRDDKKSFVTGPKTTKKQVGLIAVVDLAAEMLEIPSRHINNSSWRRFWLGKQPFGTTREKWKALAVAKARAMGWPPYGDDDSDALGQLHWLLNELEITPDWMAPDQLLLGGKDG